MQVGKACQLLLPSFLELGGSHCVDYAVDVNIPYPPRELIFSNHRRVRQGLRIESCWWVHGKATEIIAVEIHYV